jgi:hypothetical protein
MRPGRPTWRATEPSFWARERNGLIAARVCESTEGRLTALAGEPPPRTVMAASATSTPTFSWASAVEAPRCGERWAFGRERRGWSLARGCFDEHVEAAAAALAGSERGREGGLVDDAAAGAVHDLHALLHLGEGGVVDHAFGRALLALLDEGHVDGDVVGEGEDFVEGRDRDAEGLGAGFGEVRIVGEHLHAEGEGALRDFGADAAEAEHAEGLAEESPSRRASCGPTRLRAWTGRLPAPGGRGRGGG